MSVMLDNVRGVIHFEASGGRLYGFINAMRSDAVICRAQRINKGIFYGEIYLRDKEHLSELAKEYGTELSFTKKRGLIFTFLRYRFRYGFIAGLIIAIGLIFWLSNIVLQIEISGLEPRHEKTLLREMEKIGITNGAFIPSLDLSECEKLLEERLENIAWVGIHRTGCRISVQANEMTDAPMMKTGALPCNIVARYDAQITSVNVLCGNLVPIIGDGVKKGDVLISGIRLDEKGNTLIRRAMGSIRGIYSDDVEFSQPLVDTITQYTGRSDNFRTLRIISWDIPLFFGDAPSRDCERSSSYEPFCFFGAELPLGIKTNRYRYTADTIKNYTVEEANLLLNDKIALYERNFFKDVEILDRQIEYSESEDSVSCKVSYRLEGEIGEEYEILIKNWG